MKLQYFGNPWVLESLIHWYGQAWNVTEAMKAAKARQAMASSVPGLGLGVHSERLPLTLVFSK